MVEPGVDGRGQIFRYSYEQYGAPANPPVDSDRVGFPASLTVTDDAGGVAQVDFNVFVAAGNQPPTARVSSNNYVVLEGDSVTFNGAASEDPDVNCGDSLTRYEWKLGNIVLGQGEELTLTWAELEALGNSLNFPADRDSGLPTNDITLTVTDTFGATASVNTKLTVYQAKPTASVVQSPNPAMIRRNNGLAEVELNGGESASPIPGAQITGFEWVTDRENAPDAATPIDKVGRAVNYVHVFNPVPQRPEDIPFCLCLATRQR